MLRTLWGLVDEALDWTVLLGFDRVGYLARQLYWDPLDTQVDLRDRLCVVTGGTAGLGFATARALASRGAHVILACRDAQRGGQAMAKIQSELPKARLDLELVDLSSQQSIRSFAERMGNRQSQVDVLINAASVLSSTREVGPDGFELTFAVNVLGVFLLTNLMLPYLKSSVHGGRVINVSSGGMYLADLGLADPQYERTPYDGLRAFAQSKRAMVVMTQAWAEKAGRSSVSFFSVHPGLVDTPAVQRSLPWVHRLAKLALRSPEEGADTIIWLAVKESLGPGDSGKLFFDRKARGMHRLDSTRNSESEKRLYWKMCEQLTGSTAEF